MTDRQYRREIDGLRGVSILLVVLFHGHVPGFASGFVGVDVFFVISGYLITGIVWSEASREEFSFAQFYLRRARRILPALIAVAAFALLAGWFLLYPAQYRALGKNTAAMLMFGANISHYLEAGYFADSSELKPMLMTWSLSIEEQFYLFWPPILILLRRLGVRWPGWNDPLRWTVALAVSSLIAQSLIAAWRPDAAFFLLPARAWELLVGCSLALWPTRKPPSSGVLQVLGVIAIVWSATRPQTSASPQLDLLLFRVLPVVGAGMIVYEGGNTSVSRILLENRVIVFFGRISYSLYLWHWPLLAFGRNVFHESGGLDALSASMLLLVSTVLSVLSYKFVETPFRRGGRSTTVLFKYALACALVWAPSFGVFVSRGLPTRFEPEVLALLQKNSDRNPIRSRCLRGDGSVFTPFDAACKLGEGQETLFIWGDSHADAISAGFQDLASQSGFGFFQQAWAGCTPITATDAKCTEFNAKVLEHIVSLPTITVVVLAGRWAGTYCPTGGDEGPWNPRSLGINCDPQKIQSSQDRLRTLVGRLTDAGKAVVLVGDAPELTFRAPECLAAQRVYSPLLSLFGRETTCTMSRQVVESRLKPIEATMQDLHRPPQVCAVFASHVLCDDAACHASREGTPLYIDHGHLTASAARMVVQSFDLDACLKRTRTASTGAVPGE